MNSLSKLIAFIATFVVSTLTAFSDDGPAGKYQLVPAIVETVGQKVASQTHTIFRIDTATGKTWMYECGQTKDGKISEFWHEVSDQP